MASGAYWWVAMRLHLDICGSTALVVSRIQKSVQGQAHALAPSRI